MIKYILCALLGYFAGCFSPSYLLSRRRGFDIRTFGSGNAGATNMMLAAGLKLSSENRITVDMRIIKAAGLPESAAYIGMCGRDDLKRIILDYYLGKQV